LIGVAADRFVALCFAGLSVSVLAAPACSGAATTNFGGGGARDAIAPGPDDASLPEMDAPRPADDAPASGEDASAVKDAGRSPDEASVALDSGGSMDGGDDDGGRAEAVCAKICMGCCDAQGQCHPGNTMATCGAKGNLCDDCSKHACTTLTEAPCCGTNGCGCAVAGILGCN
jgi:hypothetical protein